MLGLPYTFLLRIEAFGIPTFAIMPDRFTVHLGSSGSIRYCILNLNHPKPLKP